MALDRLLFILISVALSEAQVMLRPAAKSSTLPSSEDVYSALVQVSIRCKNDPVNGLSCAAEYPDQCKEQWNFPNPCTQNNLDLNINRFVHPFDKTKFLMCSELGKLYVVQCPKNEVFHDVCGECGDAGNTAYCSHRGSGSGGSNNVREASVNSDSTGGVSGFSSSLGSNKAGMNSGNRGGISGNRIGVKRENGGIDGESVSGGGIGIDKFGGGNQIGTRGISMESTGVGSREGSSGNRISFNSGKGGFDGRGGSVVDKVNEGIRIGSEIGSSGISINSMDSGIKGGLSGSSTGLNKRNIGMAGGSIDGVDIGIKGSITGNGDMGINGIGRNIRQGQSRNSFVGSIGNSGVGTGDGGVGDIGIDGISSSSSSNTGTGSGNNLLDTLRYNICSRDAILANKLFFPFPGNVSKFIHCDIWGKPWERVCTAGEVWSTLDVTCVLPHLLNPCNRPSSDVNHLYIHPCDQSKYLACDAEGQAHEIDCASNEAFSETTQQCQPYSYFSGTILGNYCENYKFGFKKSSRNSEIISVLPSKGRHISGIDTLSQRNTNNKDTGSFLSPGGTARGITTRGSQRDSAGFIIETGNTRVEKKGSLNLNPSRQDQNPIKMRQGRNMNSQRNLIDAATFETTTQVRGEPVANSQLKLERRHLDSRTGSDAIGFNDGTASNLVDNRKKSFSNGPGTADFVDLRNLGMMDTNPNSIEKSGTTIKNSKNNIKVGRSEHRSDSIGLKSGTERQVPGLRETVDFSGRPMISDTEISRISPKDVSGSIFKLTDHGTNFGKNVERRNKNALSVGFDDISSTKSVSSIDSRNQTAAKLRGQRNSADISSSTMEERRATSQSTITDTQSGIRGMKSDGRNVNQGHRLGSGVGEGNILLNRKGNLNSVEKNSIVNKKEGVGAVQAGRLDDLVGQAMGILNGRTLEQRSGLFHGPGTLDFNSRQGSLKEQQNFDSGSISRGLMRDSRSRNIGDLQHILNQNRLSNVGSFDLKNHLGLNSLTGAGDTVVSTGTSKSGTMIDETNQTGGRGSRNDLLTTWDQIIGGKTVGGIGNSLTDGNNQGGTSNVAGETIHPSRLKTYRYSEIPFSEPCTKLNIEAGRTHFKLEGFPHMFLQCDTSGRMHRMPCSGTDWFDVYTNTCVDGPVHVEHNVIMT